MPKQQKSIKDPQGGLTAAGRNYFAKKEGAHLKPGVKGKADTPEKMRRKGSFLRRHFANPQGPMKDDKGQATRLALSAHAWGEAVPQTMAAAKKLATKGAALLKKYAITQKKKTTKKEVTVATKKKTKKSKTKKKASKSTGKKPGLYANIHKAQARAKKGGRPVRKKGAKGAPTEADFRKAKKTAKKK